MAIGNSVEEGLLEVSDDSGEDDELTSLAWLQDTNLLKNIQMYGADECISSSADILASPHSHGSPEGEESSKGATAPCVPYNPRVHVNAKPPYSFSCLIFMAIENSPSKALPVKDIYSWILTHFPYFQNAPIGWKNSVRHNLSLNKSFRKVEKKGQNIGKGSLWCIDPEFRPTLIQNLKRAPDLPLDSQLGQLTSAISATAVEPTTPPPVNLPSPDLFPYLSRRLAASNVKELELKSDPDVDAAAAMLALKNGGEYSDDDPPKNPVRSEKKHRTKMRSLYPGYHHHHRPPVITTSPSEDHTYSACLTDDSDEKTDDETTMGAQLLMAISGFHNRFPADIRVDS